ncbi:uncharacterized protein LOC129295984 [Prosopis cineraria]|uniref:uncharacterized protein LOC129295984 n=1 Tax=Prosopis cineraria TaxID=364024 RepID=UPI00240F689E|nr:uncharacterized protein LOC129295984 [Prosopis cineraria]
MYTLLPHSIILRSPSHPPLISNMTSFLTLPSISLKNLHSPPACSQPALPSNSLCFLNGIPSLGFKHSDRSRVFTSVSVGSQTAVDDALFSDYKPCTAFLFPGQGAQAVGMGKEAQNVPAAVSLYRKAKRHIRVFIH